MTRRRTTTSPPGRAPSRGRGSSKAPKRSKSSSPPKRRPNNNNGSTLLPSQIPARVYKRWIFVSIVATLFISWLTLPYWFNTQIVPEKLGKLSEYFFESALFRLLPEGGLFKDDFLRNITSILGPFWKSEYESPESPGRILSSKGAKAKYPVILIPGITSTGLELWEGKECAQSYFRQRLWGTLTMMRVMVMDSACWLQHLKLNSTTGTDPENIKLRPAQGLEAADFILPGFWVWARMIENLAEIGYDHNNLVMAAYDWRLDIINLEVRDHYFSRLKSQIELMVKTRGEKVVAVSHSLGALVWMYFMKWVESDLSPPSNKGSPEVMGGGGGRDWVEKHIKASVSIGAPHLGVPKAMSMIISGEMRDTAQMGKLESFLLEMLMSKRERLSLFRTWSGGFAMLPKGGNLFWGNGTAGTLVDLEDEISPKLGYGIVHLEEEEAKKMGMKSMYTTDNVDEILERFVPVGILERIRSSYSNATGVANPAQAKRNEKDPRTWTNPLLSPLPNAPGMKMYCLYGFGRQTERGYEYESVPANQWSPSFQESLNEEDILELQRSDEVDKLLIRMKLRLEAENQDKRLYKGIYHVDGDGTVPTLSNGFMCGWGWRNWRHLNPANLTVVSREYRDESLSSLGSLRGGPRTGEHVDILGNHALTMDILKIVSGFQEEGSPEEGVQDRIESDILEIIAKLRHRLPSF